MTALLRSVPTGADLPAAAGPGQDLAGFARQARAALLASTLDARRVSEIRRDLAFLVAESTRSTTRPLVLHTLVDAVIDDLAPALPPLTARALRESRPATDLSAPTAS